MKPGGRMPEKMYYICKLCGAVFLDKEKLYGHFEDDHPSVLRKLLLSPLVVRRNTLRYLLESSGCVELVKVRGSGGIVHECTVCGEKLPSFLTATIHFLVHHREALKGVISVDAPLRRIYRVLCEKGLIVRSRPLSPPRPGTRKKTGVQEYVKLLNGRAERAAASLLASQKGRAARLRPSELVQSVVRNGGKPVPVLYTAAVAILRQWLEEKKVIRDDLGRCWQPVEIVSRRGNVCYLLLSR